MIVPYLTTHVYEVRGVGGKPMIVPYLTICTRSGGLGLTYDSILAFHPYVRGPETAFSIMNTQPSDEHRGHTGKPTRPAATRAHAL